MCKNKFLFFSMLGFLSLMLFSCGKTDERLAQTSSSKRKAVFAFFNDFRLEMENVEVHYSRLDGFMKETKSYLENRDAQSLYAIAGLYFEKNLDRQKGAYDYADRFYNEGLVINLVVFPPEQETRWQNLLGYNKGVGKQIGPNFVFYQVFTANPEDLELEAKIIAIIEAQIEKHAAALGQAFGL